MSDLTQAARSFLKTNGADPFSATMVAGDASNRKYWRVNWQGQSAILMHAPSELGEDVRPFMRITRFLRDAGLSAPALHAADEQAGFLLIEDLGEALFTTVLETHPELESELYAAATDALLHLQSQPPPELACYDGHMMADLAAIAFTWYAQGNGSAPAPSLPRLRSELERVGTTATVLIQRDYHAQNLIWLPERSGVARVGLLDYQDAMLGHPAYDLVSILQDARRDVPRKVEAQMIDRFLDATDTQPDLFRRDYAVLGLQRNLRILGAFARLCLRDGKAHYVDLIPRVWEFVERNLAHPALTPMRDEVLSYLPAPTSAFLASIKARAA